MGETRIDPICRRVNGNADPIVLTDKKDWHRQSLISRPLRRVEGALRRRVVAARIAEGADHNAVLRYGKTTIQMSRPLNSNGCADRLGELAGDRTGLRQNPERHRTPDLVTAAGDGIFGARGLRED